MADESDTIRIDLKSDISEGERARKKLADVEAQVRDLKSSFEQGNIGLARYSQELRNLEKQADRARAALEKVDPSKLTGSKRASAKFQLGLAGANIAQDVAQGGPAAGINNILGLAGNNSVRALGAEAIAAAGGIATISAALAGVAVVAGAAFLTIDQGLKSARLDWSDFDDVIGNTAPWRAVQEAAAGTWDIIGNTEVGKVLATAWDSLGDAVHDVANLTLGWDEATEAARQHKEQVAEAAKAAAEYSRAVKSLAGIQSTAQKDVQAQGKSFAEELAEMGGKGGLGSMIDRMANAETAHTGNEKVTVPKFNEKGEEDGTEEITRREQARRRIEVEVFRASQGDRKAQGDIGRRLGTMGEDASDLGNRRAMKDEEKRADETNRRLDEQEKKEAAERESKRADETNRRLDEEEKDKEAEGRRAMRGTGLGARTDDALIRAALASGGREGVATDQVAKLVADELKAKGVDPQAAERLGREQAESRAFSLGDRVNEMAMNGPQLPKVEHISSSDFARQAEASGFQAMEDLQRQQLEQLAELVRLGQRGPRIGP